MEKKQRNTRTHNEAEWIHGNSVWVFELDTSEFYVHQNEINLSIRSKKKKKSYTIHTKKNTNQLAVWVFFALDIQKYESIVFVFGRIINSFFFVYLRYVPICLLQATSALCARLYYIFTKSVIRFISCICISLTYQ